MYNFSERLALLENLGVVGIRVLRVSDKRPGPGEKTAGGAELAVQNSQGFIGAFDSKQKVTFALAVEIERRDDLHVVWTEGRERQIKTLGDQTPDAETALFAKRIPTDATRYGEFTTKSTDKQGNGVWVISSANGELQMWEVAIVTIVTSGQSKYYLSLQKVYNAVMYVDLAASPVAPLFISEEQFPGYQDWWSLWDFLEKAVDISALKPASTYLPAKTKKPAKLKNCQAEVIWFNQAKGFGFARVNGEDPNPNFHRSQARGQEFPAFQPGQIIRYDSLNRTPRGVQLMGVTES